MGRIDELAAKQELAKAADCHAQADQLNRIADLLRKMARLHEREAEERRGTAARRRR